MSFLIPRTDPLSRPGSTASLACRHVSTDQLTSLTRIGRGSSLDNAIDVDEINWAKAANTADAPVDLVSDEEGEDESAE